jgi:hypothetical protein
MKAVPNKYPGAARQWLDEVPDILYVMIYPTNIGGAWNWGINPMLLTSLWSRPNGRVFVDLVQPGDRRDRPDIRNAINRSTLMKRLSKSADFHHKGFYRLWVS